MLKNISSFAIKLTPKVKKDFIQWYGNLKFKDYNFKVNANLGEMAYNEFVDNRWLAEQFGILPGMLKQWYKK